MDPFAQLARFFDPLALVLVVGGSVAVAALHGTAADLRAGIGALGGSRGRRFDEATARADLARLDRIARRRGMLALDGEPVTDRALARVVVQVVDGAWPEQVSAALESARAARLAHAAAAQLFWSTLADVAPAIGMIGTVAGLIAAFASMAQLDAIGPAMALALCTTLYGAVLANVVAAPIAGRIARRAQAEEEARARIEPFAVALAAIDRVKPLPERESLAA